MLDIVDIPRYPPDVLQGEDAPVPVPLTHADTVHPLTRLGQGQHLRTCADIIVDIIDILVRYL